MKFVIYGSNGFIGYNIVNYLKEFPKIKVISGDARCENYENVKNELSDIRPDRVICCIGRSSGKNIFSTSYIENKLDVNMRDNLFAQMVLVKCCNELNIHFTNIGDGCIFDGNIKETYVEDEEGNFVSSYHSIVKSYTEKLVKLFSRDFLHVRLRYPISGDFNPKCLLSKLFSYECVVNKSTSVSVLSDVLPILIDMIIKKKSGTYNLVNPGKINLLDLKIKCKEIFDNTLQINEYDIDKHNNDVGVRSHAVLNIDKILENYEIQDAIISVVQVLTKMCMSCVPILKCLCCGNNNKLLLDLNYQPLANNFHNEKKVCEIYPLKLLYCNNCYHCQLSHAVNPIILFKNYKYVSGTSQTGLNFFKENAKFITDYKNISNGKILDIACNDGSQLNYFKSLGWETFGVDPAENLCPIAQKNGHHIFCDFWNKDVALKLPIMNVITAQNVFAHTQYISDFLQNCKLIMDEESSLFIQTSQKDMIKNGEFDTTYHEHISFFNTKSMNILTEQNGLKLNRVLENNIHGKSYIFEIKLKIDKNIYNVENYLENEKNIGMYSSGFYDKFCLNAKRSVNNLKNELAKYKNDHKCIGFGAAAKGQTLLCYGNIDLDYIIDENPLKIGTYSPKLDIPIVSIEHFVNDICKKYVVVILAWNFAEEIINKINKLKEDKNIIFIKEYFPQIIAC